MIKFFRKIRQKLISENRFSKYLIYAVGEIFLVMIGILLALQVNNWNEGRKADIIELETIKGLKDDIEKDIENLEVMVSFDSLIMERNKKLIQILKDPNSEYDESLDTLFGWMNRYAYFYPQRIAYENLKSKGLETISNDSLRSQIVNLHDFSYGVVTLFMNLKHDLYIKSNEVFLKHLETTGESAVVKKPNDFEKLKKDNDFRNHLTNIYAEQNNAFYASRSALSQVKALKKEIEKEIERKAR